MIVEDIKFYQHPTWDIYKTYFLITITDLKTKHYSTVLKCNFNAEQIKDMVNNNFIALEINITFLQGMQFLIIFTDQRL